MVHLLRSLRFCVPHCFPGIFLLDFRAAFYDSWLTRLFLDAEFTYYNKIHHFKVHNYYKILSPNFLLERIIYILIFQFLVQYMAFNKMAMNVSWIKKISVYYMLYAGISQIQCAYKSLSSVQLSRSVVSDSLCPHERQHARPPCPSPAPGVHPNPCPSSQWRHPTISSSVVPFSSWLQSFPASGYFQMSQLFTSGGQSIGVSTSTSVLPMNTQDWSPLGWTGWISLQSKRLSRVFSNTIVQKHQFFTAQLSL